jgi:hypothetical protein
MTLGNAAAPRVRLIVWCEESPHQVEPDPAEMAAQYGRQECPFSIGSTGLPATDYPTRPLGLASPRRGNRRLHSQEPRPSKSALTAHHGSSARRTDG